MKRIKILIIAFIIQNAVFAQGLSLPDLNVRFETGNYFKEFRNDIFSKVELSYPLITKEGYSVFIHAGGGVEFDEVESFLLPLYTSIETDVLCLILGGEFINGSWCTIGLAEIGLFEGIRLNGGVRVGDFNELIFGLCYVLKNS